MAHLLDPKMARLENTDSPQKALYMHQALLDERCHPLCDELREYWKFFDHETVQRFVLYLYEKDYNSPKPSPVEIMTPPKSGGSSNPEPSPEPRTSNPPPTPGASSGTTNASEASTETGTNPTTTSRTAKPASSARENKRTARELPGDATGTRTMPGSRNSSAPVGTIYPRPEFVPCRTDEDEGIWVSLAQHIGCMPEYKGWSFEAGTEVGEYQELRLQDYLALGKLYNTSPDDIPAGRISSPVQPLTPIESFEIPSLHRITEAMPPERSAHPAGYDFEAVLLAHAKLYILSRSQGVHALSDLCISRLQKELGGLSVPPIKLRISNNVVQLLRYVYHSPQEMATPGALQPAWRQLQDLASQFCALNIHVMGAEQGFRALMQEGGTLVTDIMDKTLRQLTLAESGARDAAIMRLFLNPVDATPV